MSVIPTRAERARRYYAKHREHVLAYQRKWAKNHPELARARNRKWRAKHPEQVKERSRQWKAENRDHVAIYNKAYKKKYKANMTEEAKQKKKDYDRVYKFAHLDERNRKDKIWRENHKEERRLYDKYVWYPKQKLMKREHHLSTTLNGKPLVIKGLLKRCYPTDSRCELCHGVKGKLAYHHWDDTQEVLKQTVSCKQPVFLKGLWVCQPCNNFVHRLTEFPELAKTWFELKEKIEQPQEDQTYGY